MKHATQITTCSVPRNAGKIGALYRTFKSFIGTKIDSIKQLIIPKCSTNFSRYNIVARVSALLASERMLHVCHTSHLRTVSFFCMSVTVTCHSKSEFAFSWRCRSIAAYYTAIYSYCL